MISSLKFRLIFAVTAVLVVFLGLTGVILDKSFQDYAISAVKDRLQGHVYALIAAADIDNEYRAIRLLNIPETRFTTPGSGLYAEISTNDEKQNWDSPSTQGLRIPFVKKLAPLEESFGRLTMKDGTQLFVYSLGVTWDESEQANEAITFSVAETLDNYNTQLKKYQRNLWTWLASVTGIMMILQAVILRWGFLPLRRLANDLAAIERGTHTYLKGHYPRELRGLTSNLNALIRKERQHIERYRHTLADLAHSLKTPLSVLRGTLDSDMQSESKTRKITREQVDRMTQLVDYQLQRAATAGRSPLSAPVSVEAICNKVVNTLRKVYVEKNILYQQDIQIDSALHGDEGDLLEIFGNLVDNASKWCQHVVRITVKSRASKTKTVGLFLSVEDDGPGIPENMASAVLKRGVRADEATSGHGIGLSVVKDITRVYDGYLKIGCSDLGGARIEVFLALD